MFIFVSGRKKECVIINDLHMYPLCSVFSLFISTQTNTYPLLKHYPTETYYCGWPRGGCCDRARWYSVSNPPKP